MSRIKENRRFYETFYVKDGVKETGRCDNADEKGG